MQSDDRDVLSDDRGVLSEKMIINIELCIADEECGDVKISLYFTVNIQWYIIFETKEK